MSKEISCEPATLNVYVSEFAVEATFVPLLKAYVPTKLDDES